LAVATEYVVGPMGPLPPPPGPLVLTPEGTRCEGMAEAGDAVAVGNGWLNWIVCELLLCRPWLWL
jgi:hypothetical protein